MANTVVITAACPNCSGDATWYGRQSTVGNGTGVEGVWGGLTLDERLALQQAAS